MKKFRILLVLPGLLAVLYLMWVFGSRWMENRRLQKPPATVRLPSEYRGDTLKISQFYSPKPNLLCYGVMNAAKVHITPALGEVAPSPSRCMEVHGDPNTEYTITAESTTGQTVSQKLVVKGH